MTLLLGLDDLMFWRINTVLKFFCVFIIIGYFPVINAQDVDSKVPVSSDTLKETYIIGPEDQIKITVLGQGDYKFSEEKTVSLNGKILLSIMQEEFPIAGLSLESATDKLTEILSRDYLNDPRVILEITAFNSQKVLVVGEISHPGEVTLQSSSISLKELLIQSGGPTGVMDKTVIVVSENDGEPVDPIVVSLDELLLSGSHDTIRVQNGDIVYVLGRDKQLPISDLNNTVYVFGQVTKPGIIPFSRNMTVLRAIINAGNFTTDAAPGRTSIKRYHDNKIETIGVNLDRVMSGGDKSVDIELKPGDVVYVPRAIF
ncbi:SLBB domain-containing protein [bacterium]|nr:SLBB domain-containing protein [candidate division CSSED10-310 bacterium]